MRKPQLFCLSRTPRRMFQAVLIALGLALLLALDCDAQEGPAQPQPEFPQSMGQQRGVDPFSGMGDRDSVEQEKRLRALNAERQKSMVADAGKLLKLAAELHDELNGSNADSLTLDQLHRLTEIEKLAHSVKEKMSTSIRGTPMYPPLFGPHLP
jgi:hypothetical protein